MGTPEFAIPTLETLMNSEQELLAVYTGQPKAAGRGKKIQNSPVYNFALKNNLPLFTPRTFRGGKNLEDLKLLKPDLIVVVAYGLILPKELLEIPKYGCINIHPSLLPRWRGCAPLERCLMSDDEETGVCVMKIDEGLDSGDIIKVHRIKIERDTDILSLKKELSQKGAEMLLEVVRDIERDNFIKSVKQSEENVTFADKITAKDSLIDWKNDRVKSIHRKIMALCDSTPVTLLHGGNRIILLRSNYELLEDMEESDRMKMEVFEVGRIVDKNFSIRCRDGVLKPLLLQREGKKTLPVKDFCNGYRFSLGDGVESVC